MNAELNQQGKSEGECEEIKIDEIEKEKKHIYLEETQTIDKSKMIFYHPQEFPEYDKIPNDELLISCWNINGLRSILFKGDLQKYIEDRKPDILCLNETKCHADSFTETDAIWISEGYVAFFNCATIKKGYSGTAVLSKYRPISVKFGIDIEKHDLEGRTITLEFERFYLVTCYAPNSGINLVGLPYRTEEWDLDFKNYLNRLKKKKHVILCGDLNCAHQEIDIHNPQTNLQTAGFTLQERKRFDELLESGFVDTFRHLSPDRKKFSYFSLRFNLRESNKGWRIDYFLVDKDGLPAVKDSLINDKVYGSDHLPIELIVDPNFICVED